jgi:hypothetical protein
LPSGKSNRERAAGNRKKKATARQHAAVRVATRRGTSSPAAVPLSTKQISQGRFPGETPLTGEDRPATRPGGKQHGFREPSYSTLDHPAGDLPPDRVAAQLRAPTRKRRPGRSK